MTLLRTLAHGLRGLVRKRQTERELDEELEHYLEMSAQRHVRAGLSRAEAVRAARLELGGIEAVKETVRGGGWEAAVETLARDVRYGARTLRKSPAFTAVAVLTLALGIGATTAMFTAVNGVLLRPLPYRQPERLVTLWEANAEKGLAHEPISPVNFGDYRALRTVFEDAAAWWRPQLNLDDDAGDPIRVTAIETSDNLFAVLGVRPALGRPFTAHPALYGPEQEAIISHRLWQSRFAGDPAVVGQPVRLNGRSFTIVGIMPAGFGFPGETDLWQHLEWDLDQHSRGAHFMESVARLRPGVTPADANRELAALGRRLGEEFRATNAGWSPRAIALEREVVGVFRPALWALFGAAALLLLIACINVASLLLARATLRRREVALRAAIGASHARLVRLFLTESLVLALAGAALGFGVALAGVKALLAWSPVQIPRADAVAVDLSVLAFATALPVLTALAFGLAPSLLLSRADLQDALKDGAKGSSLRGRRLRNGLVVAQVALAVTLLAGAGLLVRSVVRLLRVDVGVDAASVVTTELQLPDAAYGEWERVDQFYTALVGALRARPEVAGAGVGSFLPLGAGWRIPFRVPGAAPRPAGDELMAQHHSVDEGYFAALRVPLVRGRTFGAQDDARSAPVVVVNETFARQTWPGEDAVGKRVVVTARGIGPLGRRIVARNEQNALHEVIGVVRDIKNTSLRSEAEPALYFAERQFPYRKMQVVVRARVAPGRVVALLREEVRRLDPALPAPQVQPLERLLAASVDPPRFVMLVLSVFATLALALAAIGIYGMLSYTVSHRRREFGIRLALGAQPGAVLRLILREGLGLAAAGCAIGVAVALAAGQSLSGLLFGVAPWDPVTLGGVVGAVAVVTAVACLAPGRRASAEDPAGALRAD